MSDQRIGTATLCLTPATLPYSPVAGCTHPYPRRHGRGLGPGRTGGADAAVGAAGARPRTGITAARGPGPRSRGVPARPASRAGAVGGALGALAGLPAAGRPG